MTKYAQGEPSSPKLLKQLDITGYKDIDEFLTDVFDTMAKKGHDYRQGNDADLLHNFRTVAQSVDTSMEKVWFTYFYKHYSALTTFIKEGGQRESEPIEGRIKDLIVYLVLFYRMVQENHRKPQEKIIAPWWKAELELREELEHITRAYEKVEVPVGELPPIGVLKVDPVRSQELAGLRKAPERPPVRADEPEAGFKLSEKLVERILSINEKIAENEGDGARTLPQTAPFNPKIADPDPELEQVIVIPPGPTDEMVRSYQAGRDHVEPKLVTGDKLDSAIPPTEGR